MNHTIFAFGRLSEPYWQQAAAEYARRLSRYGQLSVVELPEARLPRAPTEGDIRQALEAEGRDLLARLPKRAHLCGLFIEGRMLDSPQLAQLVGDLPLQGHSEAVWLVGSSHGLSAQVAAACHKQLSLSRMTLPHQLARVLLLEQLYRAESILAGTAYHK